MNTEQGMLDKLRGGGLALPPLSVSLIAIEPRVSQTLRPDAIVEARWGDARARFVLECKSRSTPKEFRLAVDQLLQMRLPPQLSRMVYVPYLSEEQLQTLEAEGMSGVDLCGNGVVIAPGQFSVFRYGSPNRFTSSEPIKNIYRNNTSMVARAFLARPRYESVNDLWSEVGRLNTYARFALTRQVVRSTVSKALKSLEDDLIIERKPAIRLLQADRLLENLSKNYLPANSARRVRLKVATLDQTPSQLLMSLASALALPIVATGLASIDRYAVMPRSDVKSYYCPRLEPLLTALSETADARFPNVELIETESPSLYFDARQDSTGWWSSPVQAYLELNSGDKRDQVAAAQLKAELVARMKSDSASG